jgi:flavin reductase (DIM6/NTAB) family NADH-FMN oxidoreductase RutF
MLHSPRPERRETEREHAILGRLQMTDPTPLALALGRIPTGLYVVTTLQAGRPLGFVGSFLMQVGLAPPVVSVAISRDREHLGAIRAHGRFCVSVLDGTSQKLMAPFFKRHEPGRSAFDQIEHRPSPAGVPILAGALAWLDCRVAGEHSPGDHVVVFGVVEHGDLLRTGDPAVHLRKNGLEY